jgi:hypothetical protein
VFLPVEGEVRRDGSERGETVAALEEENRQLKHIVAERCITHDVRSRSAQDQPGSEGALGQSWGLL